MAESNPRFLSHPIAVVDYDLGWPDEFARERQRILERVGAYIVELEHYGSTAIPGWQLNRSSICWQVCRTSTKRQSRHVRFATLAVRTSAFKYGRRLFTRGGRANEATHHLHFVVYRSPAW
jgi:GrpB-like predicted nucleotidyltransferase (UPF0157 family)